MTRRNILNGTLGLIVVLLTGGLVREYDVNQKIARELAAAQEENRGLNAQQEAAAKSKPDGRDDKIRDLQSEVLRLRAKLTKPTAPAPQAAARKQPTPEPAAETAATTAEDESTPFTIGFTNSVPNGHTVMAGGWSRAPGKRTFLFATPELSGEAGVVRIKFSLVDAPDDTWEQTGGGSLATASRHASSGLDLDPAQFNEVNRVINSKGADSRHSPAIQTSDGNEAVLKIGGNGDSGDISISITPHIDPSGQSVVLGLHSEFPPPKPAQ